MITIYHNGILKGAIDVPLSTAKKILKVLRQDIPGNWWLAAKTTGKYAPTFVFGN